KGTASWFGLIACRIEQSNIVVGLARGYKVGQHLAYDAAKLESMAAETSGDLHLRMHRMFANHEIQIGCQGVETSCSIEEIPVEGGKKLANYVTHAANVIL